MMRWSVAITSLLLVAPSLVVAQSPDPGCFTTYTKNADSLSKVQLASTQLTAYQRRARARLDSLLQVKCFDGVGWAIGRPYASLPSYPLFPVGGPDTTTVCYLMESTTGLRKWTWPPVRVTRVGTDSSSFQRLDGDVPLTTKCRTGMAATGVTAPDSVAVVWRGFLHLVNGKLLWRPSPAIP